MPLHMVKKEGSWPSCDDFYRLNLIAIPDSYLLTNTMDSAGKIAVCWFFCQTDLQEGTPEFIFILLSFKR
jgi:hypothetical protein